MTELLKSWGRSVVDAVSPSGVEHSVFGTAINVSRNGTGSVPAKELESVLFKRFEEMHRTEPPEAE
jgi:hypothetical protein